jgi:four helix bundle protein
MAFAFEKLVVYNLAVETYSEIRKIKLSRTESDRIIARQLSRASLSIPLNIAEGSGKQSPKDRRNFLLIARGSLHETASLLDIMNGNSLLDSGKYERLYDKLTQMSKMLYVMIKRQEEELRAK